MKKKQDFVPRTTNEIKIFILFLLDQHHYSYSHSQLMEIIYDNCNDFSLNYEDCLNSLIDDGHVAVTEKGGEKYYTLTDSGHMISAGLYEDLDPAFREKALAIAIRHISIKESGTPLNAYVTEMPNRRYRVTMEVGDRFGELMKVQLTFTTREEAETIKENFLRKPDGVFRGTYFAATGELDYVFRN